MLKRTAALLAAGLLTLPACSGDDAADSPTTATSAASPAPTPPASSPAPTTEPHVTTTLQPATSTVPTPPPTASPTTATATTPSPSTSPALDDEAAIRAVIDGYYQTFRTCLQDIPNCSVDQFGHLLREDALARVRGQIDLWHQPPPFTARDVEQFIWSVESFSVRRPDAEAVVCEQDSVQYLEGGEEVPVRLQSWRNRLHLQLVNGEWLIVGIEVIDLGGEGQNVCA